MLKCDNCGNVFDELEQQYFFATDLQKGYERVNFCSKVCLKGFLRKKVIWMSISLILGLFITIGLLPVMGFGAVLFVLVPYSIRQLRHSLKGGSEFLQFIVILLASYTLIYPLYKLIQEVREYLRIRNIMLEV